MKHVLYLVLLIVSNYCYSQHISKEGLTFEVIKAKEINEESLRFKQIKISNKKITKVMVKIKIKSDRFNKTKLSAISLVDSVHKIRYSLMDYIGSACAVGCAAESPVYRKTQFYDKKGKPIKYGPPFDSSQKDYFYDYSIEGINDFNMKLKFGSKKHLKSSQIYFGEASSKKVNGNFYFTIFNEFLESNYELYYKDEKIADIEFEVVKEPLKTYNTDWSY